MVEHKNKALLRMGLLYSGRKVGENCKRDFTYVNDSVERVKHVMQYVLEKTLDFLIRLMRFIISETVF